MTWYVRNVREGKWWDVGPRGFVTELVDEEKPQVGVNLFVLMPGNPMSMYHWEADQEGFLVLSGEALLIVEGEERTMRAWDYFHCPPNVSHTIVGAGSGPAAILAIGARGSQDGPDWGGYPYSRAGDEARRERRGGYDRSQRCLRALPVRQGGRVQRGLAALAG
jgi:uncharacterized cupin superfamily protein